MRCHSRIRENPTQSRPSRLSPGQIAQQTNRWRVAIEKPRSIFKALRRCPFEEIDRWRIAVADLFLRLLNLLAKWKPDWLYESMPYVYTTAGITTIYYFGTPPGYMAGTLLLCAAFLIWLKRKEHRNFKNKIK